MHGVGDVNMSLFVLAESVSIAPNYLSGWHGPVVDTFIGVRTITDNGKPGSRIVGVIGQKTCPPEFRVSSAIWWVAKAPSTD
jgi:hypothetical protein